MIEHIEYQGFVIVTINGWFHVYEPLAQAYIGEHNPPEEMYLAEFEDIEEAKAYCTSVIISTYIGKKEERARTYGENS